MFDLKLAENNFLSKFFILPIWLLSAFTLSAQQTISERIYTQVDCMPQWKGCESSKDNMYKLDRCTVTALKQWFLANMEYPDKAIENKTEHKLYYTLVFDTTGNIVQTFPMQTESTVFSTEADKLIQMLQDSSGMWICAKQGKKKVKVAINICLDFNLTDWKTEQERRAALRAGMKQDSLIKSNTKSDTLPRAKIKH